MKGFLIVITIALEVLALFDVTHGHGMMINPVSRSSRWRYNASAPANYDDSALFCGGFETQYTVHDGKCGLCGDDFGKPTPRDNELGGLYGGPGVIVQTYEGTNTANFEFNITINHKGYVFFELCNLDKFKEESEECFMENRLEFADGSSKIDVGTTPNVFNPAVILPIGLSCEHCVLRWTYYAGNNWNFCEDGINGALGCGPQETFKNCCDIRIKATN